MPNDVKGNVSLQRKSNHVIVKFEFGLTSRIQEYNRFLRGNSEKLAQRGRQQKLTLQQIEIERALSTDLTQSVTSICEHLGMSRPTYYRYIAANKTQETAPKTMQIQL